MAQFFTSTSQTQEFVDSVDAFVLDCDGVLYSGPELIPHVAESIESLRKAGKRLFFATNNSTTSRRVYLDKFHKLGLGPVEKDHIFTSAMAAGRLLLSRGIKPSAKIYVVGEEGLFEELEQEFGFICLGREDRQSALSMVELSKMQVDEEVVAVVCGYDGQYNLNKMTRAFMYLSRNPHALFIATDMDATYPFGAGVELPGNGCLVNSIATASGRQPLVAGKPSPFLMQDIIALHSLNAERVAMCGDRLDSDVAFARGGGVRSVLVLTGATKKQQAIAEEKNVPTYIADSLAHFVLSEQFLPSFAASGSDLNTPAIIE